MITQFFTRLNSKFESRKYSYSNARIGKEEKMDEELKRYLIAILTKLTEIEENTKKITYGGTTDLDDVVSAIEKLDK